MALDNAPAHVAKAVRVPRNVALLPLPSYSPELNPVERLWLHVRQRVDVFDEAVRTALGDLREHVAEIVRSLTPEALRSLTGYGYILERRAWTMILANWYDARRPAPGVRGAGRHRRGGAG